MSLILLGNWCHNARQMARRISGLRCTEVCRIAVSTTMRAGTIMHHQHLKLCPTTSARSSSCRGGRLQTKLFSPPVLHEFSRALLLDRLDPQNGGHAACWQPLSSSVLSEPLRLSPRAYRAWPQSIRPRWSESSRPSTVFDCPRQTPLLDATFASLHKPQHFGWRR